MTPADRATLRLQLLRDEGLKLSAYQDHLGFWTIGVGRLIDGRRNGGITADEANYLLDNDIAKCERDLQLRLPVWPELSPARQRALLNMRFQLGSAGFFGFKKMLAAVNQHDYKAAAQAGFASKWAKQDSSKRAQRVLTSLEIGMDGV